MSTQITFILFLFFVLALVSPFTRAQLCYVTTAMASSTGTQCKAPPYRVLSEVINNPVCNFTICQKMTSNNIPGEFFTAYLRNPDAIPQPTNFIELLHYGDDKCTSLRKIEYYENAPCTKSSGNFKIKDLLKNSILFLGFYATCDVSNARVQRYTSDGCGSVPWLDNTYPLGKCSLSPEGYVMARCGTSAASSSLAGSLLLLLCSLTLQLWPRACNFNVLHFVG